jgi:alanine racemase
MKLEYNEKLLQRPLVWLEIDSEVVKKNMESMSRLLSKTPFMAVLKANAYGMGASSIASIIKPYVDCFGVVGIGEGIILRKTGIKKPIVNLGIYTPDDAQALIENAITPTLFTYAALENFEACAASSNAIPDVWIEIDTGLGRLGVPYQDAFTFIQKCSQSSSINIAGVYSTLTEDNTFDGEQLRRFSKVREQCIEQGIIVPTWSIASSAAMFISKKYFMNMVRIGLPLFGYYPSSEAQQAATVELLPAVAFKTRVACIKDLEPGEGMFYRRAFVAKEKTRIAVLLPGYSYGLDSQLVNGGRVLIKGEYYPLVGGISATNCFVNIGTNSEIVEGDEVVIFGEQGDKKIQLKELCNILGQSEYEILSRIPDKVTRVYT